MNTVTAFMGAYAVTAAMDTFTASFGCATWTEAIKRRMNIVPFDTKPASPDRDLETKLRQEGRACFGG